MPTPEQIARVREVLDDEVRRSPASCPGGRGCECCAADCDCGCRDECPVFRSLIYRRLIERLKFPN